MTKDPRRATPEEIEQFYANARASAERVRDWPDWMRMGLPLTRWKPRDERERDGAEDLRQVAGASRASTE